jgi:hypothetical protein
MMKMMIAAQEDVLQRDPVIMVKVIVNLILIVSIHG